MMRQQLCESHVGWQTTVGSCEDGKLHPPLMSCNSRMSRQSESRRSSFFIYTSSVTVRLSELCKAIDLGSCFSLIWLAAA